MTPSVSTALRQHVQLPCSQSPRTIDIRIRHAYASPNELKLKGRRRKSAPIIVHDGHPHAAKCLHGARLEPDTAFPGGPQPAALFDDDGLEVVHSRLRVRGECRRQLWAEREGALEDVGGCFGTRVRIPGRLVDYNVSSIKLPLHTSRWHL